MKKRILLLTLCACMMLSCFACKENEKEPAETEAPETIAYETLTEHYKAELSLDDPVNGEFFVGALNNTDGSLCAVEASASPTWSSEWPGNWVEGSDHNGVTLAVTQKSESYDATVPFDMYPTSDNSYSSVVGFTAPWDGKYTVEANLKKVAATRGVTVRLMKEDGTELLSFDVKERGESIELNKRNIDLKQGEKLLIVVSRLEGETESGGYNCAFVSFELKGNIRRPVGADNSGFEGIATWMSYSYDKVVADAVPTAEENNTFDVYLTRGETEGCQIYLHSGDDLSGVVLSMKSGENENISASMFSTERTHTIKNKEYPDSAIPYFGKKLKAKAGITLSFIVEFTTTKDTPAGDYQYTYELKDKSGELNRSFTVNVHVWDIILPEDKTFATACGMWTNNITGAVFADYYELLLDHGMSAYNLPYNILDERADAYMSDPRVTSFRVPSCEGDDEQLLKYYEKLKSNPVWLEKAYLYPIDEPREMSHLNEYRAHCERYKRLCPEIPVIAPFYTNIKAGDNMDQVDHMAVTTELWCPKLCLWDDAKAYEDVPNYSGKSFADRMDEMRAEGDTVWAYVCNDPVMPYAQMFIDTPGNVLRSMYWQMYQRDCVGFLYWSTTHYGEGVDPWNSVYTKINDGDGKPVYGCGFLLYPGMKVGIPGAVPSIRLKISRDGIDDIELFYLAEELLGKDWVLEKTEEVTATLTTYCDNATFDKVRIEIGNAVEAALANE